MAYYNQNGAYPFPMPAQSLLWIFIDGLGIGSRDPLVNPLARFEPRVLRCFEEVAGPLPKGGLCRATDACLGVPGLPQSATGQATLFTGVNAPKLVGGHRQGYPDPTLRTLVSAASVFTLLSRARLPVTFANVYTPRFFDHRPRWVSVTTVMAESAGVRLRTIDDLKRRRGLFMDYTNRTLIAHGFELPEWGPLEAGGVLAGLAPAFRLCLYEYFLTDLVGHRGTMEEAESLLRDLDCFLAAILEHLDLDQCSLLVSSDHGNIEDKTVRQHTRNPVPTLAWGPIVRFLKRPPGPLSLDQIAPLVMDFLGAKRPEVHRSGPVAVVDRSRCPKPG